MKKDMGAFSGSREPDPASGSGPSGFDPARIVKFAPKAPDEIAGKRPVYLWEIDSAFLPEQVGKAWTVVGYRDECRWPD